jgi:hypothetical protein
MIDGAMYSLLVKSADHLAIIIQSMKPKSENKRRIYGTNSNQKSSEFFL